MKLIALTQGYEAKIDDDDYERVSQYKWCADVRPNTTYAVSQKLKLRLHQFIMNASHIDHKDRDGLNCQKENMRLADHQKNGQNIVQPQSENGSGFRGVKKHHSSERWIAQIRIDKGKRKHIGSYTSPEEAAKAYDQFAKEHHGEYAVLNFSDGAR